MPAKLNIYLARHAESENNASLGTCVSKDVDDTFSNGLTQLGIQQASKLGEHLANVKFGRICSSDYLRAIETVKLVLKGNAEDRNKMGQCGTGMGMITTDQLRDLDFGDLRYATYAEKTAHYVASNKPLQEWSLPAGESFSGAGLRMYKCFINTCVDIFDTQNGDLEGDNTINVLIVSHSLSIAAFLHYLSHGKENADKHLMVNWNPDKDLKVLGNCCYYRLEVTKEDLGVDKDHLRIEVMEKFASSHLADLHRGRENRRPSEQELKLRNVLMSSKKGKEIVNCCQQ